MDIIFEHFEWTLLLNVASTYEHKSIINRLLLLLLLFIIHNVKTLLLLLFQHRRNV